MAYCLCELHLWSLKNQYAIPDDEIGCHSYHLKDEIVSKTEHPYQEERQRYEEGRDIAWNLRNKRPERLRDNIKEVEELLSQFSCVQIRWKNRQVLQLVLNNAAVVSFILSGHCGDVDRVFIDRSFVGKLSNDVISDAILTDQFLLVSFPNSCKLDFVYFTKRPPLSEAMKRLDRLSSWEPKLSQVDVPGPKGRRLERNLCLNCSQDMVLLWWSMGSGEAWPWTPMSTDRDRANIIIISTNGPLAEMKAFTKSECDPIHAQFSNLQPHRVFTLEQQFGSSSEVVARSCTYEIIQGEIQTATAVCIPLKSTIVCQARNNLEDKLLLGLSDASLVMYDDHRKVTLLTRAAVPPANISWHPNGTLILVSSARADIQIFDRALTPLKIQLIGEDVTTEKFLRLSKFFRTSVTLREQEWCPFDPQTSEFMTNYTDAMFLSFSRGPAAVLQFHLGVRSRERFSCVEIVKEFIKYKQFDEAVSLLSSMNWDIEGQSCYTCLSAIVNSLLRMPLNADREAQLEAALATFYAPKPAIADSTILEYRDPISRLARRFFHHLLRYIRFDKAFLLAVDIGARDLFMDIHYMAADKGETALAEVAKRKAELIESEGLDNLEGFDENIFNIPEHNANIPTADKNFSNGGESFLDQLPSSRKHPWQQDFYSRPVRQGARTDQSSSNAAEFADESFPDIDDLRLHDDLINDYTAALFDEHPVPGAGNSAEGRFDNQADEHEETEDGKKVKVIHFGIV